jgi:benzoyl-CoA reductase/2-hydroxyglutaryl-CoA dehydratase subunit BcrC/BadD/HgdB
MTERVGFTTTIPVEVLFAGGVVPCDLNNIFITDAEPGRYIERAERDGFPKSMCNWIKGIYGVVMEQGVQTVITVMEGDCSNTQALSEILRYRGIRAVPFSFPYDRDKRILRREIEKLMDTFSVKKERLVEVSKEMDAVRSGLKLLDRMTWRERVVTGHENHLWLVRSSDMLGDYRRYGEMVEEFLKSVEGRDKIPGIPLGYVGVPPIVLDLHGFVESLGAHIVFNETQRQFSLPFRTSRVANLYARYTYPYGIFPRLADIEREIKRRRIRGIIHYVQAFCFRVVEDVLLRETLGVPVLTIEGEFPKPLDTRTKMRIEAFVEMLRERE